jgi:sec-independent protein translocase protein TatA
MPLQAGLLGPDILIIALIILVLFGGSKIPQLAKGLGQGMKEFKDAVSDRDAEKPAAPAAPAAKEEPKPEA